MEKPLELHKLHPVFLRDLYSVPWFLTFDMNDINYKINFVNENLHSLFNFHAPIIEFMSRAKKPWITDNIKFIKKLGHNALTLNSFLPATQTGFKVGHGCITY